MKETPHVRLRASFAQTVEKAIMCQGHRNATAKGSHDHQDQTETEMEVDHHEEEDVQHVEGDKAEVAPTTVPKCGTRTKKGTGRNWRSNM